MLALTVLSTLLQFVAAGLAFRLMKRTGRRVAWGAIALAFVGMGLRRAMSVYLSIAQMRSPELDLTFEVIGLVISVLLVGGLYWISPVFLQLQRSEERLRDSEARLRQVIDLVPHMIFIKDREGRFLLANQAMAEAYGLSPEALEGRRQNDLHPDPDEGAEMLAADRKVMETGQSTALADHTFTDRSGRVRHLQTLKMPYRVPATGEPAILGVSIDLTERRELELAQRRERDFVATLLQTADALIIVLDRAGRVMRFNRACERLTGYTLQELQGKPFWDLLLSPEEAPGVRAVFGALTAGQFPNQYENHWLTRTGQRRLVAWSNTCLVDAAGEVEYIIATGVDITEQRTTQVEMARLNSVLKAIRDVNQLIRLEHGRPRLLQACCATLLAGRGYTKAWLVTYDSMGKLAELYSEGLGEKGEVLQDMVEHQVLPQCARAVAAGRDVAAWVASGEACAGCGLAGPAPCPTRMTAALKHEDSLYGVLCVCLPPDMPATEEEQELLRELADDIGLALHMLELAEAERVAQRSLALERDRLMALHKLGEMPEATLRELTDFALEEAVRLTSSTIGYLAFMNEDETVLTMHAWSKSAMQECAIIDKPIVYPVVSTGLWGEAVRQRQPIITNDYAASSPLKKGYPTGHVQVNRHMNLPIFDGDRIVIVAGVGNKSEPYEESDVRQLRLLMQGMWRLLQRRQVLADLKALNESLELKVAERTRELERSNQELQQFAYVASHDLQEPLRMVSSYVQLLAKRYRGQLDSDADDFIGFAVDGAERMSLLIQDLLAYSRVGTQGKPFVPVELESVLAQAQRNLQAAIGESGATITHEDLPTVLADGTQLTQLLQNLLGNALKFRQRDVRPEIHVSAEPRDGSWLLAVRDNGIGLDMAYATRIFTIFQRLHPRDEYPGTGMGLAICSKIVERHGGRLWVESAPGEGATFYFTLPMERGEDA